MDSLLRKVSVALAVVSVVMVSGCVSGPPTDDGEGPTPSTPAAVLRFTEPLHLAAEQSFGGVTATCEDRLGECGLLEPSIAVDAIGAVYVTAWCCRNQAAPVLASRDLGATFQPLGGDGVRGPLGATSGMLALDGAGRIHLLDAQSSSSFRTTVWDADGTFLRHAPWPEPSPVQMSLLVDSDGTQYVKLFGLGRSQTFVMQSSDDGLTWAQVHVTDGASTGQAAIHPGHEICFLIYAQAQCSRDAGVTWSAEPTPVGASRVANAAFDEAGNLFAAALMEGSVAVAWRDAAGTWLSPIVPFPGSSQGTPSIAAGRSGAVALVWFEDHGGSQWFLHAAVTANISAPQPVWETHQLDSIPSVSNPLDGYGTSALGPAAAFGPDGALHIAYTKILEETGVPQLYYVRSEPTDLGMEDYWWGPSQ